MKLAEFPTTGRVLIAAPCNEKLAKHAAEREGIDYFLSDHVDEKTYYIADCDQLNERLDAHASFLDTLEYRPMDYRRYIRSRYLG